MSKRSERSFFLKKFVIILIALICIDFVFMSENIPDIFKGEPITFIVSWKKIAYWLIISLLVAYSDIRKRRKKSLEEA